MLSGLNKILKISIILALFWAVFWLFNGFDKFFNGTMEPMMGDGLEKAVLVDAEGNEAYYQYAYEINGPFGVNRNAKTISFLERIGVPEFAALTLLYTIAIVEIMLAIVFIAGAIQWMKGKESYKVTIAVAYKLSVLLFVAFCATDILIGERIELWEHTTFMLALLFSLFMFQLHTGSSSLEKLASYKD